MRIRLTLILVLFYLDGAAQSIPLKVISTAGSNYVHAQTSLQWTFGELSAGIHHSNTLNVTEGFNQNIALNPSTALSSIQLESSVEIYPNPVADVLEIRTQHPGILNYEIINIKGQRILLGEFNNKVSISLQFLDDGKYLIILTTSTRQKGVYSFIKSH